MMHKRGLSLPPETLIVLILILLTFAVLLYISIGIGNSLGLDAAAKSCQLSITIQAKGASAVSVGSLQVVNSPFNIACDRRTLTITDTKATSEIAGKQVPFAVYLPDAQGKLLPQPSYSGSQEDAAINSILAESMRRCWDIGLDGKVKIFNPPTYFTAESVCLLCDQVNVQVTRTHTGLGAYMSSTDMPNSNTKVTYASYLFTPTDLPGSTGDTLSGGTECLTKYNIDQNPTISTGTYATVLWRSFSRLGLTGSRTGCIATYVVPADKLNTLCAHVAN